jgi:hypothetical protein
VSNLWLERLVEYEGVPAHADVDAPPSDYK